MHLVYKKIKKNINIILQNKWDLNLKNYVYAKHIIIAKKLRKNNNPLINWKNNL